MPLNQHHVVWRSWGEYYDNGVKQEKPTITLCGNGNTSGCHGLAHSRRVHFRWNDGWQYLRTDTTDYVEALEEEGWRDIK